MFNWIRDLFLKVVKAVKPFLLSVFNSATQIAIAAIKDIALASVEKLAATDLSNEEKRNQAFQEIKGYAITKGITVRDSLIFLVIEMAVNALKNASEK